MSTTLINPWLEVSSQQEPPYLAMCDRNIKLANFRSLHTELLPQPYLGNVATAKVVCLLLNPGYSGTESSTELNHPELQQALRDNLIFPVPHLVYLDDNLTWTSGSKWLRQKVLRPLSSYGVTRDNLNRNFAIIEYFPYHSKTFDNKLRSLPLESQKYGFELVRQAIERDAIILLMRGESLWLKAIPELIAYQNSGNYITPHSKLNVILSERNLGKDAFSKIIQTLKS